MSNIDELSSILIKLGLSCLSGAVIGFERKVSGKPAGLRTNMLICLGSTLIMAISIQLSTSVSSTLGGESISKIVGDPARLAAQVVSGIGFLGAGAILQSKGSGVVIGLTTAATIWTNAAIGLAIGAGFYTLGFVSTGFVVLILFGVKYLEQVTRAKHPRRRTLILILKKAKKVSHLKKQIYKKGIIIDSEMINKRVNEIEYRADIHISPVMEEELMNELSEDEHILSYNVTKTL
ncbi:MAG: MgtC/SapB family protein [Leptospiraceae bacterium]|nr:MgtC/SapB family protein [Leptospiraceae bacterium]